MSILDLSHPLHPNIPMFPGLPTPEIELFRSRAEMAPQYRGGTSFVIHRYHFIGNSGTYLDSPFHRYEDGPDLATLPLAQVADLPGVVIDLRWLIDSGSLACGPEWFAGIDLAGRAVLVCTGWDRYWDTDHYLAKNPHLTAAAADLLVSHAVRLVGIDSWNIDNVEDLTRPVHSVLLAKGIPIVENLRGLASLIGRSFRFHAAPLAIPGGSAIPVRAYAVLTGEDS